MNFRNDGASDSNILQNQFTSYLQIALQRKKRAYLESQDRYNAHEFSLEESVLSAAVITEFETVGGLPYEFQIQNEELLRALSKLSERERLILLAHVLEGIDFDVLAREYGLSYKGVSAIYYRLCAKIRKYMGGGTM